MKALVYTANERMTFRDEPAPCASDGDALVAIDAVGICGSDMHAFLGHDPRRVPPLILGHEACGTVLEGTSAGARVVLNPLITCGACDMCQGGRSNLCPSRELIGMRIPGAFAERIAIPERNLIVVPDGLDAAHAALAEPAATSVHAVRLAARALAHPVADAPALVLGGGSVGLFAALALRDQGCRDVALAETNALRRASAEASGACRAFDPIAEPPREGGFALVVDAVGSRASRETASRAVAPGGVVAHVGLADNDGGLDLRRMTLQEVTLIGTYTYTPLDLRASLDKLASGAFGSLDWIEQRPLADGAGAFDDLLAGRSAAPKIVLRP